MKISKKLKLAIIMAIIIIAVLFGNQVTVEAWIDLEKIESGFKWGGQTSIYKEETGANVLCTEMQQALPPMSHWASDLQSRYEIIAKVEIDGDKCTIDGVPGPTSPNNNILGAILEAYGPIYNDEYAYNNPDERYTQHQLALWYHWNLWVNTVGVRLNF